MQIDFKFSMQEKHVYLKTSTCSLGELDVKKSYQNLKGLKFLTKWLQGKRFIFYTNLLVVCIHYNHGKKHV